jgi:hypothetical protein
MTKNLAKERASFIGMLIKAIKNSGFFENPVF